MVREFGEPARLGRATAGKAGLNRPGIRGMEGAALGREQLVIGGFLHKGMPERIPLDRLVEIDHEELGIDGFVKSEAHIDFGHSAHVCKDVMPDPPSSHSRDLDEAFRAFR